MIERDFILRMIRQLTEALARVAFKKNQSEYDDALLEIETVSEQLIGVKWKVLRLFSDAQLTDLFGNEDTLVKMLAVAELLREESEILDIRGKADESLVQGLKAFSLFAELILRDRSFIKQASLDKFAILVERLEEYSLTPALELKRIHYFEFIGNFAKAEEVLRDLIDQDVTFIPEGISFYRRILKASREELDAGNLPQDSAEEGLASLESRLSNLK